MPDREPDQSLIRAIGETLSSPLLSFDTAYRRACSTSDPEDWHEAACLGQQLANAVQDELEDIASRVERYYAERPVSDEEVSEAVLAFQRTAGFSGNYYRAAMRAALEAARKVRGGADG